MTVWVVLCEHGGHRILEVFKTEDKARRFIEQIGEIYKNECRRLAEKYKATFGVEVEPSEHEPRPDVIKVKIQ